MVVSQYLHERLDEARVYLCLPRRPVVSLVLGEVIVRVMLTAVVRVIILNKDLVKAGI